MADTAPVLAVAVAVAVAGGAIGAGRAVAMAEDGPASLGLSAGDCAVTLGRAGVGTIGPDVGPSPGEELST
jgi:hypothetical protein